VLADLSQTVSFVSDSCAALWCWPPFILHWLFRYLQEMCN